MGSIDEWALPALTIRPDLRVVLNTPRHAACADCPSRGSFVKSKKDRKRCKIAPIVKDARSECRLVIRPLSIGRSSQGFGSASAQ
jgi:hypothetical protein